MSAPRPLRWLRSVVRTGPRSHSASLRIAVVEDAVGPWSKGGREVRYAALLPRLAALGLDVEVFTMRWWDSPPQGPVRYTAICPLVPMYKGERRSNLQAIVFALSSLRLLRREMDVILADQIPNLHLFPLRLVAWVKGVPLAVQWHELWGVEYWTGYLGRLGRMASLVETTSTRLPDQVVAGSSDVADRLAGIGVERARLHVIPNAIDRARLETVQPLPDGPDLIVVGRLIGHKHVDDALRAAEDLRARGRAVRVSVIGDGPDRERLVSLAAELGVEASVEFLGRIEEDGEVWSRIKSAQVLVFPSDREGFGLTVAESLALGTPVVCVAHPANDAVVLVHDGVTGSIVAPGDRAALADAVERWLVDDRRREEISTAFWAAHADLDWDRPAHELYELLRTWASAPKASG